MFSHFYLHLSSYKYLAAKHALSVLAFDPAELVSFVCVNLYVCLCVSRVCMLILSSLLQKGHS